MKLTFVSNYFNHHQLPFCDALYELLEGDFCFLQTQPTGRRTGEDGLAGRGTSL